MFFDPITGPILGSEIRSTTSPALERKAFASFSGRHQSSAEVSLARTAADVLSTSGITVEGYSGIRSAQPSPSRCGIPLAPASQSILKEPQPKETTAYPSETSGGGLSHNQTAETDAESKVSCIVDSLLHVEQDDLAGLTYAHVRALQDYFLVANDPYYAHEEEEYEVAVPLDWSRALSSDLYIPSASPLEEERALGLSPIRSPVATPIQPYLAQAMAATPAVPTALRHGSVGRHEDSPFAPSEAPTLGSPSPIMPRASLPRSVSAAAVTPFSSTPPRPRVVQFRSPYKEEAARAPKGLRPRPQQQQQRVLEQQAKEPPTYKLHGRQVDIMVSPQNMCHGEHDDNYGRRWTLADFEVGPKLGEGRFGKIYLARERRTKFGVVLKCLSKEMLLYNDLLTQMHREIELQSYVGRHHRHVLKMHGYFWDHERIFLLLEYADGGSLSSFVSQQPHGRLSEVQVRTVARQLSSALRLMHRFHILHRDIKPENVLLRKGKCKLADFSWAVRSGGLRARRMTVCGTLDYLSPEQVLRRGATPASDMWSLGVMCYELLTGKVPFGDGLSPMETCACIAQGEVLTWPADMSTSAKSFVRALLQVDETRRLTAAQALQHPFLVGDDVLLCAPAKDTATTAAEPGQVQKLRQHEEGARANLGETALPLPHHGSIFSTLADITNIQSSSTNNVNSGSHTNGAPLRFRANTSGSFLASDISMSVNSFTCGPSAANGSATLPTNCPSSAASGLNSDERSALSPTLIISSLTATSFDENNDNTTNHANGQNGSASFSGVSALSSSPEPPTPLLTHLDNRRMVQPVAAGVRQKESVVQEVQSEKEDVVPAAGGGRGYIAEPKRSVSLSQTRQDISHSLARSGLHSDSGETDRRVAHRSSESCVQRLDFDCYSSSSSSRDDSHSSILVHLQTRERKPANVDAYGKGPYQDYCCTPPLEAGSLASSPALSPVPFHQD